MTWNAIVAGSQDAGNGLFAKILRVSGLSWVLKSRSQRSKARDSTAFTSAFVSLAAKMAKADGVALEAEAEAFEKFLEAGSGDVANVRRIYALARQDTAGYEAYASRIAELLRDDPETKRSVLECLFFVACSDGILHPAEDRFLRTVAEQFGYDEHLFACVRATFVHDPHSAYTVLDVGPEATDADIRARYRKLVAEIHPDRMIAAGAPAALVKTANAKLAAINAAYERIINERKARR